MSLLLRKALSRGLIQANFSSGLGGVDATSWTCPLGVTKIKNVILRGQNGTAAGDTGSASVNAGIVGYRLSGMSTYPGTKTWADAQAAINAILAQINNGGSGNFQQYYLTVYPTSYALPSSEVRIYSGVVPGSAYAMYSNGWQSTGSIVSQNNVDWSATIAWSTSAGNNGSTGASTFAFGQTGPGGVNDYAQNVFFAEITVVPGTTYNFTIPTGGVVLFNYEM